MTPDEEEGQDVVEESLISRLDNLQTRWRSVQPLAVENERRLQQKLRLEWNYNSNHLEGNTLTYGETELLLIQGLTVGGHAIREYEEMKAHDLAVEYVYRLTKDDERVIGETDIRDLNKIVLKEPFWKDAETSDGRRTRKQVIPGEYKSTPNNVRTPAGEIFEFAKPSETSSRMLRLIDSLRAELKTPTLHPIEIASKLHHEFLLIHPFDDGNGRVGRLLINYVLNRAGFPPLIVKSADKINYLAALRLADVGQLDALTRYLGRQLEWSLNLSLRAAYGESLEEPSDIEKEIAIFIREQDANRNQVKKRSPTVLQELYNSGWEQLFSLFENRIEKLSPLFAETAIEARPVSTRRLKVDWRGAFDEFIRRNKSHPEFSFRIHLNGYKSSPDIPFNVVATIGLKFEEFRYSVVTTSGVIAKKLYSEPILSDEAETISGEILRGTFAEIKAKSASMKPKSS